MKSLAFGLLLGALVAAASAAEAADGDYNVGDRVIVQNKGNVSPPYPGTVTKTYDASEPPYRQGCFAVHFDYDFHNPNSAEWTCPNSTNVSKEGGGAPAGAPVQAAAPLAPAQGAAPPPAQVPAAANPAAGGNAQNAGALNVGDRVTVSYPGNVVVPHTGTVVKLYDASQPPFRQGCYAIHFDYDFNNPNSSDWYCPTTSIITKDGAAAPIAAPKPGAANPAPAGARAQQPTPNNVQQAQAAPPPAPGKNANQAQGATGSCQEAVRGEYPPGGDDQTMTVTFNTFDVGAAQTYEAVYAGDLVGANAAHGHVVQAMPVHATFTVLRHFASPNAPDELETYEAHYMCYQSATTGEWTMDMKSRDAYSRKNIAK